MSKKKADLDSHPCLQQLKALETEVRKVMQIQQNANCLNKYRLQFEITQPTNLVGGTLQQHQLESLEWMINLAAQQANGILADDMGLGKTIQAIAYLAYLKQEGGILGKHLIVCPKSVTRNWINEISKWLPSARAVLLHSTEAEREQLLKSVVRPRKFDILVTSYQGAKKCLFALSRIHWQVLVIDEAHKIKNVDSLNFKMLYHLQSTFKLLLTGTPLSNNLKELWSLLFYIMPDIFSNPQIFEQIQTAVEQFEGTEEEKLEFKVKIAKHFHNIIGPYFKRRAKKDLELGIPPKIERTLYVPLSKMQLQMYRNYLRYGNVYGEGLGQNRNMMQARKICLHPYLFEDMWPEQHEEFGEHGLENCGKLKVLDKLLNNLLQQKHKVLLFSQFTMFLDILEQYCDWRQFKYCRLDGNTELDEREQYMKQFNQTDKYQIFMLSTKAGGLGINLTGADRVIIYDLDWNPQNDIQAMDRAHRIGQTKPVHVYKFITQYTIEERVSEFQKYKLIWDQLVIQKGGFMRKKREDPFKNLNLQSLVNIGRGDIFRLKLDNHDRSIEEILALGEQKDKKKEAEIRKKLQENIEMDLSKFNPFQEDTEQVTVPQLQELTILKRRNYEFETRERAKFDRNYVIPAFKFYLQRQKIKEVQFEIHMELKRPEGEQSKQLLKYLRQKLEQAQSAGKFHDWDEDEFNLFINAHQLYLKTDYKHIAEFIGTKTESKVEEYSNYFFNKAPNNERLSEPLKRINIGQAILKLKLKQGLAIDPLQSHSLSLQEDNKISKTSSQLMKEIALLRRFQQGRKSEEVRKKQRQQAQQQKKRKAEERKKREEERKIAKEQQARLKLQRQLEREEKKKIRDEENKRKVEARQKQLLQWKQKKEKKMQEMQERKQERKKLMQQQLARKQQEKRQQEIQKNDKLLNQVKNTILKQIQKSSESRSRKSNETTSTNEKKEMMDAQLGLGFSKDSNPLEIVTAVQTKKVK